MRTRLKDIAQDLKISTGLVSGVLNGRENVWASEETRKKIFEAAKRLNYIPTVSVRSTPATSSGRIELIYCRGHRDSQEFLPSIIDAVSTEAERSNLEFVVSGFSNLDLAVEYLTSQAPNRVDPVVLVVGDEEGAENMGSVLSSRGTPFLVFGRLDGLGAEWSQFSVNFEEIIRGAIDHVRVQGHRRIAYIGTASGSSESMRMRSSFVSWTKSSLGKSSPDHWMVSSDQGFEGLQKQISRLLSGPENERPTGFVIGGAPEAWLALELCLSREGQILGFKPGMPTASGLITRPFHLLFGDALGYDASDPEMVAEGIRPLIAELVSSGPRLGNHQVAPRLTRIPSLQLSLTGKVTEPRVTLP